ncbi:FlgO family outer membrane protein [Desulfonatronum thioautotrophicum]|uniref:FlgO family outer membrane protein n=1 Tax=Desulfonatronum thioautotrophicum TaxID=617001 RepID=UPI0006997E47|nr:FlgO family outer membrane protein [Desulfonatronum thioautotrophicum]
MTRYFFAGLMLATLFALAQPTAAMQPLTSFGSTTTERGFHGLAYALADGLEHNLVHYLDRTRPILFTSFVDLDDLNTSSTFGRLLGEQVAARMSQHGFRVVELKLRQDSMVFSQEAGEMVLSRDLRDVRNHQDTQAVLVGTYVVTQDAVIVSAKLLSTLDGTILATRNATLRKTRQIQELIAKNRTTFRPAGRQSAHSASEQEAVREGPLARGTILLDPGNALAARLIQARLAELNYYNDRIDGIWGRNSRAALNRFKSNRQLASPTAWDLTAQRELFKGTGQ